MNLAEALEELEKVRAELGRAQRTLAATKNAVTWWIQHYLAATAGKPCPCTRRK